ncbi:phage tail tape measure protein [Paenibacillus chitinolyticus]|uniref:Phage tail tape measure protein n=1 Tax=Paenibacillus chitinolyticus TaxID=79263 RepID=A0ABT4F725_9BACL|nr:phage tail tape measure protein [Paenibacillus chitinolyticus]MCY9589212.1 phage tail tape measure protein [Paenibacillus chitinolyticus]MCY9594285.1 phage tail tape measure protein [Paenibacillus chitinolyticus]
MANGTNLPATVNLQLDTASVTNVTKMIKDVQYTLQQLVIVNIPPDMLKPLSEEVKETDSALKKAKKTLDGFANGLKTIKGIQASFMGVVTKIDEFNVAMKQVQASTGVSKTEMVELEASAKALYKQNLGGTWNDLAGSLSTVKQLTNQQGAALQETTKNAIVFKDVFGKDVKSSAASAEYMMKDFGISSTEAYNLFAQGAQKGLEKSGNLLDSVNKYGAHFKTMGFSANQMFNTFGLGTKLGVSGLDTIGGAMKEFSTTSTSGSKDSVAAFKALNMDAESMTQIFSKGGPEAQAAFNKVATSLASITDPMKRNEIGIKLFGTSFKGLQQDVLMAMGSARSEFDMTKNTMAQLSTVKYDTLGDAFNSIGRQLFVEILQPIQNMAMPVLSQFADSLIVAIPAVKTAINEVFNTVMTMGPQIGSFITGFLEEHQKAILGVAGVLTLVFGPALVKTGLQALSAGYQVVTTFVKSIVKAGLESVVAAGKMTGGIIAAMYKFAAQGWQSALALGRNTIAVLRNVAAMALLKAQQIATTVILWGMAAAQNGVNLAFLANPITLVVIALAALVAGGIALYKNWDTVKAKAYDLWTAMQGTFGSIGAFFSNLWTDIKNGAIDGINFVINAINSGISKINGMSINVPSWLGGGTFGMNIPPIQTIAKSTPSQGATNKGNPGSGTASPPQGFNFKGYPLIGTGYSPPKGPPFKAYAKGGIVSSPELAWIGEGGDREVIIPINNSDRSRGLYAAAGRMLGVSPAGGSSGSGAFVFNPSYNFYGNADQAAVQQMEQRTRRDFEREFNTYLRQKARVSFV